MVFVFLKNQPNDLLIIISCNRICYVAGFYTARLFYNVDVMIVKDLGQLFVFGYNFIIFTKEMSLPAKPPLLERKGLTRFQKARFDTSPFSVACLKCCLIAFFLKETHLFLCLLNFSSFSFVGYLSSISV